MKITSYGAADGVTGSCHVLEVAGKKVLIDCGIFQGSRSSRERNEDGFGFDPTKLDYAVVSHAHLDHIGRVPLLQKRGFRGTIISTRPTFELGRLSLLDSAGILEQDAIRKNRKRKKGEPKVEPLYDEEDVLDAIEQWNTHVPYNTLFKICDGVEVSFHDAGHILGSAFLDFRLTEGEATRRFVFSGDLGNVNKPIIRDPQAPTDQADVVMVESTYGNRIHKPFDESVAGLEEAIRETVARGGNVIIPTFALERAQELLYVLHDAWNEGRIPHDLKIFLDSPMAISATRIFQNHPDCYDRDAIELFAEGHDPFKFPALRYTRQSKESMAINDVRSGAVILAGSGMVTGGRVLHHLRHNLARPECSVCFIGYQAEGTKGRQIIQGKEFITIFGQSVPTGAQVYTINGFSGHAGQDGLTDWTKATNAKHVFLVHGETDVKKEFKSHLEHHTDATSVQLMQHGHSIDLLGLK